MISSYRNELERRNGRKQQVAADLEKSHNCIDELVRQARWCEEAQTIIQTVAQVTQQELEYHVGELVTLAMAAVFEDPYQLDVEFVQRRGRTETDLWFSRDGSQVDPLSASGGGAVDVASFALRVALWSLAPKRTRPVLILDEALKWLKGGELPEKGARMIKEISERLGLQIIMISHIPDQIEGADKRIGVTMRSGVSQILNS